MKIIQTFWTGSQTGSLKEAMDIKAGWPTAEYHWMSWAMSCLQACSLFDQVELVTDDLGKQILVDRLGLPYTNVSTALEGTLDSYPSEVWALAKIFSYSIQTEPFLHIDGDVFLWEKPDKRIMEAGIISQNLEKDLPFYKASLDGINKVFQHLPPIYQKGYYENKAIYSGNAGLIGGNDLEFFKIYCKEAFAFIDLNREDLGKITQANLPNLNFLFEQYALYQIALKEKKRISFYLEEVVETPVYEDLIRFQDRPFVKMIHPVGSFKKQLHLYDHLSKSLRLAYPSFYYKIIDLVRGECIPMTNKVYYTFWPDVPGCEEESAATQTLSNPFEGKENKKKQLFDKIFNQPAGIASAYRKEALTYENLQKAFSLDRPEMLHLIIQINEDALLLDNIALVPSIVRVTIYEYNLDQLDTIFIQIVTSGSYTIDTMIKEIKQYFDADEIKANPTSLEKLVFDTLKRLCYAGLLQIVFADQKI
jgi:hypothetical protein